MASIHKNKFDSCQLVQIGYHIAVAKHHYHYISSNFESFRFTHSSSLVNLHNNCCNVVTAKSLANGDILGAAFFKKQRH